jgi:hypothetical protein
LQAVLGYKLCLPGSGQNEGVGENSGRLHEGGFIEAEKRLRVVAGSPRACGWVKRGQACEKVPFFLGLVPCWTWAKMKEWGKIQGDCMNEGSLRCKNEWE